MPSDQWWENGDTLLAVAGYGLEHERMAGLNADSDWLAPARAVLDFYEKPWHYDVLHDAWLTHGVLEEHDALDRDGIDQANEEGEVKCFDPPDSTGFSDFWWTTELCSGETCASDASVTLDKVPLCAVHLDDALGLLCG